VEDGILLNSGTFDGLSSERARDAISDYLEKEGRGGKRTAFRLRDWASRDSAIGDTDTHHLLRPLRIIRFPMKTAGPSSSRCPNRGKGSLPCAKWRAS